MTFPIGQPFPAPSVSFSAVQGTAEANQGADDGQHVALQQEALDASKDSTQRVFCTWFF
jgi:hypothetical protein